MIRNTVAILLLAAAGGCTAGGDGTAGGEADVSRMAAARVPPPPGAAPDSCWVRDVAPAVIQTVTEQIEAVPARLAPDGRVLEPASYRTETHQAIVEERRELVFQTPCPAALTPEFIASLQRALTARKVYGGPVTGRIDAPTMRAVRRYQSDRGLPSGLISMETARNLGLVAVVLPEP